MQEHFNRLLQNIAERKGTDYGDHFVRNVVSRNLHHMSTLQDDMKVGIGLTPRSGHHHDPHSRPELAILDREYQEHELHSRRPGRVYPLAKVNPDNFRVGLLALRGGALQRWTQDTTRMRASTNTEQDTNTDVLDTGDDDDEHDGGSAGSDTNLYSSGTGLPTAIRVVDGHLIYNDPIDIDQLIADIEKDLQEEDNMVV